MAASIPVQHMKQSNSRGLSKFERAKRKKMSSEKQKTKLHNNLILFVLDGTLDIIGQMGSQQCNQFDVLLIRKTNLLVREKLGLYRSKKTLCLNIPNEIVLDYLLKNGIETFSSTTIDSEVVVIEKDPFLVDFEKIIWNRVTTKSSNKNQSPPKEEIQTLFDHIKTVEPMKFGQFVRNVFADREPFDFKQFTLNHMDSGLSVSDLAFLSDMSLSSFKRLFFRVFKTTPKQYFINYKMKKSLVLLKQNRKPIQIATLLGYDNLNAFSAAFKKNYGLSPRNYLKGKRLYTETGQKNETFKWN